MTDTPQEIIFKYENYIKPTSTRSHKVCSSTTTTSRSTKKYVNGVLVSESSTEPKVEHTQSEQGTPDDIKQSWEILDSVNKSLNSKPQAK